MSYQGGPKKYKDNPDDGALEYTINFIILYVKINSS